MTQLLETVVALQQALDQLTEFSTQTPLRRARRKCASCTRSTFEPSRCRSTQFEATIKQSRPKRAKRAAETGMRRLRGQKRASLSRSRSIWSSTQREYSAILQEIDLVTAQSRELEEQTLVAMESQEEAETAVAELRGAFESLDSQYAEAAAQWEIDKPGVGQQAESTRAHIAELREEIPASSRLLFERVRERTKGKTLAEVMPVSRSSGPNMWHCGACHYNVRPQSVVDILNHGDLILCDSCKRILFISESED